MRAHLRSSEMFFDEEESFRRVFVTHLAVRPFSRLNFRKVSVCLSVCLSGYAAARIARFHFLLLLLIAAHFRLQTL